MVIQQMWIVLFKQSKERPEQVLKFSGASGGGATEELGPWCGGASLPG